MSNLSSSERTLALMIVEKMLARTRQPTRPRTSQWHSVLDSLSWLCDDRLAGKSVASISVHESDSQRVMCLTTNDPDPESVKHHLYMILHHLSRGDVRQDIIEATIVELCVKRSNMKVNEYARKLQRVMSYAVTNAEHNSMHTSQLLLAIQQTVCNISKVLDLCTVAYRFRSTRLCQALRGAARTVNHDRNVSSVYHHIGRLGAWHHAARIVVQFSRTNPQFFGSCVIESVPHLKAKLNFVNTPAPSVIKLLRRLLNSYLPDFVVGRFAYLSGISEAELQTKFEEDWYRRTRDAHVHSEVSHIQYVQDRGLEFINNDRYIGCSKPSCYFCALYLGWSSLQILPRPCHSKSCMGWCLASLSSLADSNASFRDYAEKYMVQNIQQTVLRGSPVRSNMFDSTAAYTDSY